jgi:hypothetical protein
MVHRHSLRRLLAQLYQRKADVESLIYFFERYGKRGVRRRIRPTRYAKATS